MHLLGIFGNGEAQLDFQCSTFDIALLSAGGVGKARRRVGKIRFEIVML